MKKINVGEFYSKLMSDLYIASNIAWKRPLEFFHSSSMAKRLGHLEPVDKIMR